MSITPPPTPPAGVEGGGSGDGLLDMDGLEGDSEDFIDFILADPNLTLEQGKDNIVLLPTRTSSVLCCVCVCVCVCSFFTES